MTLANFKMQDTLSVRKILYKYYYIYYNCISQVVNRCTKPYDTKMDMIEAKVCRNLNTFIMIVMSMMMI